MCGVSLDPVAGRDSLRQTIMTIARVPPRGGEMKEQGGNGVPFLFFLLLHGALGMTSSRGAQVLTIEP